MQSDFIGAGWSYPLGAAGNGAVAMSRGVDRLEQAMRIVLSTYPGERAMRPDYGCRLRDFQFDPVSPDVAAAIAAEVTRALNSCEPRVEVDDVEVVPVVEKVGLYYLDIRYVVAQTNHERNLVVPFYSIPGEGERAAHLGAHPGEA